MKLEGKVALVTGSARGTLMDLTVEVWRKVLEVNLNGVFHCCKAVVPHMIRSGGGKILNISSIAGKTGDLTAAPVYGTSYPKELPSLRVKCWT